VSRGSATSLPICRVANAALTRTRRQTALLPRWTRAFVVREREASLGIVPLAIEASHGNHPLVTEEDHRSLDYEQVVGIIALLTDVRFKLLALVPTISGTAVGLLTSSDLGPSTQVVLAVLGFVVTVGIVFYEQRNTQFYNNAIGRAEYLEKELRLGTAPGDAEGGYFRSRARKPRKFLGVIPMRHDRALGLIYASVLGAWAFAAVAAVSRPQTAAAVGAGVAALVFGEFEWHDGTHKRIRSWMRKWWCSRRWRKMSGDLRRANLEIGVAEQNRDLDFLDAALHNDLVFRRADGSIVGKEAYLRSVDTRTYYSISTEVLDVDEASDSAVVTAIVTARGTADGKPFGGTFRNVRAFIGGKGRWRCLMWINTRSEPDTPPMSSS
jgi:hypothetical protein